MQTFLGNINFIKHKSFSISIYILLDPFVFPYYFYRIQEELIYVSFIVVCIPTTFCPILKKICRHKMFVTFNEICIYIYIYIYIYTYIYIYIYSIPRIIAKTIHHTIMSKNSLQIIHSFDYNYAKYWP